MLMDTSGLLGSDRYLPGQTLYREVLAGFVRKGDSLTAWCRRNGVLRQSAKQSLMGIWDGPKGRAMRLRLLVAAGLISAESSATQTDSSDLKLKN